MSQTDEKKKCLRLAVYVVHSPSASVFRSANVAKLHKVFMAIHQKRIKTGDFELVRFVVIDNHESDKVADENDLKKITDVKSDGLPNPYDRLVIPLTTRHVSNSLKHVEAWRKVASGNGGQSDPENEISLVLEDDVLYNEQLMETSLAKATQSAPLDWDVLMLGLPTSVNANDDDIKFQEASAVFKVFPSCESYLIRPHAATRLAQNFLPLRFPTNTQMSWLMLGPRAPDTRIKTYIVSPSVFLDGSKYGTCTSMINMNNRLTWNPEYVRLFGLIRGKTDDLTKEDIAEIDRLYDSMNFKHHPDAMFLYAVSFIRRKDYVKAEDLMEQALKQYEKNKCVQNRTSEFLNAYCDLYRDLQC